ncbi:citramalate synthase [Amylibacter sp.]|jgi:2-isopropylmalate synthase|nr:citramalate synthase [Amylibacter sp.]MDA9779751.1 citramalate synthase [Amylibacter sp.]MDB4148959.1 citramalate synthase [Amylibacter sp.]MDC0487305.1 citramalate synthase [Amylibacter sp.]MDC1267033.1 citramalate synthase [Amylibacter sp.]
MKRERIYLYDTTLRDGQQTQGVNFTVDDKIRISNALDELGIDYVEGGWPGANPTDSDFFNTNPKLKATFTAFGMTKRSGKSAENDEVLSAVLNANTPGVCLVGKAHDFHVIKALGVSLEENLNNISDSVRHIVSKGREALFDCEHFFDGYRENPTYALKAAKVAYEAGARWIVLCDTNGGALPSQVFSATKAVIDSGIPGDRVGIHTHNDTEHAIANSLAAIDAGARQVQGTLNGLGERCGNANLVTLIPTLLLKDPYSSLYETGVDLNKLSSLTSISRTLDDILNRVPDKWAAYVGSSAFAHKAGLHASAILKDPQTYEHIDPIVVGNERVIPMSNQAGQSNLKKRLMDAGLEINKEDSRLSEILNAIKDREDRGYAYDSAQASFELVARKILGQLPTFFEIKRYRVTVEKRKNKYGNMVSLSEAVVVAKIGKNKVLSVSESMDPDCGDQGPVNALSKALAKDLGPYQNCIDDMTLTDYKVRITGSGTDAVTRVIIDSQDGQGRRWSTVGVSANIVDASFEALLDAINWKLIRDNMKPE